jgi:hypothetical protein
MRVVPRRKKDRGRESAAPGDSSGPGGSGGSGGAGAPGPSGPGGATPGTPAPGATPAGSAASGSAPAGTVTGERVSQSFATKSVDPAGWTSAETLRRRARSSERQRAAAEVKRSRAGLRGDPALRRQAVRDHRTSMLVMVLLLGLLIATVVVSGALVAASMQTRPITLAAPLHIFPVSRTVPGQCPAGTAGISGQASTGPACYQLSRGLAIRRVADLGVQRNNAGRYEVAITLRNSDRQAFATLTRRTLNRDLAFVVRNQLITVPRVDTPILDGKIVITGPRNESEADALVRSLRGR